MRRHVQLLSIVQNNVAPSDRKHFPGGFASLVQHSEKWGTKTLAKHTVLLAVVARADGDALVLRLLERAVLREGLNAPTRDGRRQTFQQRGTFRICEMYEARRPVTKA